MKKLILIMSLSLTFLSACNDTNRDKIQDKTYLAQCYSNGTIIYEHKVSPLILCGVDKHICSWEITTWKEIDTGNEVALSTNSCIFTEIQQ